LDKETTAGGVQKPIKIRSFKNWNRHRKEHSKTFGRVSGGWGNTTLLGQEEGKFNWTKQIGKYADAGISKAIARVPYIRENGGNERYRRETENRVNPKITGPRIQAEGKIKEGSPPMSTSKVRKREKRDIARSTVGGTGRKHS